MNKRSTTISKKIVHPNTGKKLNRVYVEGRGWYGWNTVFHVYNSKANYEQLREADRAQIDFNKC